MAYHILKYISCDGMLSILYAYHFRLLHDLRFKAEFPIPQRLSVPHFLLLYIIEMSQKVREGRHQHIAYHGLIKLIFMDSINHLGFLVLWNDFVYMDRETFIETQNITSTQQEGTPTSSIWGREGKEEMETKEEYGMPYLIVYN